MKERQHVRKPSGTHTKYIWSGVSRSTSSATVCPPSQHFQGHGSVEECVAQRAKERKNKRKKESSPQFSFPTDHVQAGGAGVFDLPCPPESHSEVGVRCDGCGTC